MAPTNHAIERIGIEIDKINETKNTRDSFLEDHIVEGKLLYNHLSQLWKTPTKIKTLSGKMITFETKDAPKKVLLVRSSGTDGKAVIHDIEFKPDSDQKPEGLIYLLDSIIDHKGTLRIMHLLKYF